LDMNEDLLTERKVKILKALADPTRLRILSLLKDRERCVCELIPMIGKAQATISKHLDILYESGILSRRTDGRRTIYSVKDSRVFEALKIIELMALDEVKALTKAVEVLEKKFKE